MARLTELPAAPAKSSKAAKPTKDPAAPVAPTSAEEPDPLAFLSAVLTSQEYFTTIASLLLLSELVLSAAIVHYVPYTEIDWTTYQQQVASFLGGERDYSLIKGSTGPLVYPAGFLYFYTALHYLTSFGKDIRMAQYVFAEIYVVTLGVVFAIFKRCGSVPPYMLVLMTLSKRMHSIYMLRLFNDGVAMLFFYLAVLAWVAKKPKWTAGSLLFSLALSVKMNFILYLPALAYIFLLHLGPLRGLIQITVIVLVQLLLASPFLSTAHNASAYLRRAFDFSRAFEWKWTVNWRWLGEEAFHRAELRTFLLVALLGGWALMGLNWAGQDGGVSRILGRAWRVPMRPSGFCAPAPDRIVTLLFTSNLLGIVTARSLHYQFYAWYFHQIPFLLQHTPYESAQRLGIWAAIEYGWSTYPSSVNSSMGLTFGNVILLAGVWFGWPVGIGKGKQDVGGGESSIAGREGKGLKVE